MKRILSIKSFSNKIWHKRLGHYYNKNLWKNILVTKKKKKKIKIIEKIVKNKNKKKIKKKKKKVI